MNKLLWPAAALISNVMAQIPVQNNPLGTPNLVVNGNFTQSATGWTVQGTYNIQQNAICVNVPASSAANAAYIKTTNFFTEVKNDVYYLSKSSRELQ